MKETNADIEISFLDFTSLKFSEIKSISCINTQGYHCNYADIIFVGF